MNNYEVAQSMKDIAEAYLAGGGGGGGGTPEPPTQEGYVEFNTPYEIVRDARINGWVKVNAPYVTFENLQLTGINKDTNLFWAGHGTKLLNSVLRASPEGQHRGVMLNGAHDVLLVNTEIRDIWHPWIADTQAFAADNDCKRFAAINCFLEAAGEVVIFGGGNSDSPDHIPEDILIRDCVLTKNIEWKKKLRGETCKNLLELKNAKRVKIINNRMRYSWGDGQSGNAIVFHVRQNERNWHTIEDVLFKDNIVEDIAGGLDILGRDYFSPTMDTDPVMRRIRFESNTFKNISNLEWNGTGRQITMQMGSEDFDLINNHFSGPIHEQIVTILTLGGLKPDGTAYKNIRTRFIGNVYDEGWYGIHGDKAPSLGTAAWDMYMQDSEWNANTVTNASGQIPYPGT